MKKLKPKALVIAKLDEFLSHFVLAIKIISLFEIVLLLNPSNKGSYSHTLLNDIVFLDLKSITSETEYRDLIRIISSIPRVKMLIVIMNDFDPDLCRNLKECGAHGYVHRSMTLPDIVAKIKTMVFEGKHLLYTT